jgi:hypothetical protein
MAGEYLWVTEGNAEGSTVALDDEFAIGRSESGEGRLGDDPEISRSHARFYRDEAGRLMVADLGSTNGTFVNETRISAPQALQPGDRVRTGKTTMQVVGAEDSAAAEATVLDQPTPPPPPPPPAYEPAAQQPAAFQAPTQPQEPAAAPGRRRPGWLVPVLAGLGALLLIGGIVAVILVAGGDDDGGGGGDELRGPEAEETVKDYLRGFVDGDGDAACDTLTDDYREEIVDRLEASVEEDVSDCPELIEALEEQFSTQGGLTFEGEELTEDSIEDLDLKSDVEVNTEGEGESATVTGPNGQQTFELEPVDGEWKISDIPG